MAPGWWAPNSKVRLGKDKVQIIRTHSRKNYKDTIKEKVQGHIPGKKFKDTIKEKVG